MPKSLATFQKVGDKSQLGIDDFVNLQIECQRPYKIDYQVRTTIKDEKHLDEDIFRRKQEVLNGVQANFSYEMEGRVDWPEDFAGTNCQVIVNPLHGSDRYCSGSIDCCSPVFG